MLSKRMRALVSMSAVLGTLLSASVMKPVSAGPLPAVQNSARTTAAIVKEVRHELVTLPYYGLFDWLEGEVRPDGTLVLRGEVVRPSTRKDAESRVKEVEGVEKVVNEIEVLPVSPNDDRIRAAIYRALFNGNSPLFRYATFAVPPIHIIVKNGRVTLKGIVGNQQESQIANVKARSVSGVFEVKNELQVEGGASH